MENKLQLLKLKEIIISLGDNLSDTQINQFVSMCLKERSDFVKLLDSL